MTNGVQGHYFIKFEVESGFKKTKEDKKNKVKWMKICDNKEDVQQVLDLLQNRETRKKTRVKWLIRFKRTGNYGLRVKRTRNLKVICKNIFLPTAVSMARNVNNFALKIFFIIISLPFDVLCFPIRLVTLIPSIIADRIEKREQEKEKRNHPLHQYLIKQTEINSKLLVLDTLFVTYGWKWKPQLRDFDFAGFKINVLMRGTINLKKLDNKATVFKKMHTFLPPSDNINKSGYVFADNSMDYVYGDPTIDHLYHPFFKLNCEYHNQWIENQKRKHYNINFKLLTDEEEQKLTPKLKRVHNNIKAATISNDLSSFFGLSQSFTEKKLEKAYKNVALIVHPDKNPKANELAKKLFQMIGEIYQTLKNGPDYNIDRTQNFNPVCPFDFSFSFGNYNQRPFGFNF